MILPLYNLKSQEIKGIMNAKDERTIRKRLEEAGVPIRTFGSQEVVSHEDIIKAVRHIGAYRRRGDYEV